MTLCERCGFTIDGELHRDYCVDPETGLTRSLWVDSGRNAIASSSQCPTGTDA